ncbi:c-type cytochrome biogenesis protein CcmI [Paracoccus sp. 1_MG-2023]|uniref:c-type cytochrome biogenesis protein CcmI n=1 Tax=unclassified Paracoccus (in: a-proteobacteria) TaxID=2688777 RepID=UPI001C0A07B9|nr:MULTISPECIES: c-type cytochrome biogenesis protein CcmI [unclassified Paracoccus (in: a-proteobacteria)]MBU2957080.1 c-type cytochrome biogenesis protein CcmI [Paracoccus sp. C2R09]MDO6669586.1 c-type cytochrome biogenesis protein CcmI [Paracoccus sp. 1_MG-2023]
MFWIVGTAMIVATAAAIILPLRRAPAQAEPAAAYDLRVYRDQLSEVDRDLDRGILNAEDAERLRREIGRKVLDADRRASAGRSHSGAAGRVFAGGAIVLLLAVGVMLYLRQGVPGAPDLPLQARFDAAEQVYRDRPSQAQAEGLTPAPRVEADDDYLNLVAQLRERVAERPEDPQGLTLLAESEANLGNLPAARAAQERLVALRPTAGNLAQLATVMVDAAGGIVTPEAETVLARTLAADPRQPQARYLQGVLMVQNGRPDRAFPIWRDLLEAGPDDAPWNDFLRATLPELAWLAGQPDYELPALPGPSADDIAAAADLDEDQRAQMIDGMVEGLRARLAAEGGSPAEWARLIGALAVQGRDDDARAILSEAREIFSDSASALDSINAAAERAGLNAPAPAPDMKETPNGP